MNGRAVKLAGVIDSSVAKECSVPLINKRVEPKTSVEKGMVGFKAINIEEIRQRRKAPTQEEVRQKVKISLQDCFSCSGCITSAETVLVEHHNTDEVEKLLRGNGMTTIISISTQSLISVAELMSPESVLDSLTPEKSELVVLGALQGMAKAVQALGARSLVPLFVSQLLSCESAFREFYTEGAKLSEVQQLLPVCPGWVCLCTKRYPSLTKLLSHTMSPMSMFTHFSTTDLYECIPEGRRFMEVSVQPCYDRKLEAARQDLEGTCDFVITTAEFVSLIRKRPGLEEMIVDNIVKAVADGLSFKSTSIIAWDNEFGVPLFGPIVPYSCGGYSEYFVMRLKHLGYKVIESKDVGRYEHITVLEGPEKNVVTISKVASLSGIYNMAATMEGGERYNFAEVFACDSGCERGNGQCQFKGNLLTKNLVLMEELRRGLEGGEEVFWRSSVPATFLGIRGITLENMYEKFSLLKMRSDIKWEPVADKPKDPNVVTSSELDW